MRIKSGCIIVILGSVFLSCAPAWSQTAPSKADAAPAASAGGAAGSARNSTNADPVTSNPVHGSVLLGAGFLDQDSYKFGEWTGITQYGPYPVIGADVGQMPAWDSTNPNYWQIGGTNLGLPSQSATAETGKLGSYSLVVSYQGIPHYQWQNARTPYTLVDGNYLRLPAHFGGLDTSSQAAWNQSVATNLRPNLHDVDLKTQRNISKAIYRVRLDAHWSVMAEVRHDHKDGLIDFGSVIAQSGGNPASVLLPLPVNYNMNQIRLESDYHVGALDLAVAYLGSFYHDNLNSYRWDVPYLAESAWNPGAGYENGGMGLASTPPDNVFHQMLVSGSWGAPFWASRIVWDLAYGLEEQSASLLPYTINPDIVINQPLPVKNPAMQVDTTQANLRFVMNPLERMEFSASFRFDDHADKSPTYAFYPVLADAGPQSTTPFYNVPYSYLNRTGKLQLAYSFGSVRPFLTYQYKESDQSFVEVGTTQTNSVKAGFSWQPGDITQIRLTGGYERRHGTPYLNSYRYQLEEYGIYNPLGDTNPQDPANYALWANDPLLQMFWLADRTRRSGQFTVNLTPSGPFSVGLDAQYLYDDYTDSTLGLLSNKTQTYTIEAGYYPTQKFGATLYGTYQRLTTEQAGISFSGFNQAGAFDFANYWALSGAEPVYEAGLDLDGKKLNVGLRSPIDLKFTVSYTYSSDQLNMATGSANAADAGPLPNLTTRTLNIGVSGNYPLSERLGLQFGVGWQRYVSTDWHFTGVYPWTIGPSDPVLTMNQQAPDYSVTWFSLAASYRF